jgi:uncharacterized LabA/DUF88 family protein
MASHAYRVAVFIDWQNAYQAARRAFALQQMPTERGVFSPYKLAQHLAAGNDRGADGKLVRVEIHRGLPNSNRDPVGYAANRRQSRAWMTEAPEIMIPMVRPLRYPRNGKGTPEEKGIDVRLALSAVEHALLDNCEVSIIFSHDTDLVPAIETISRITSPNHVETASWVSPSHNSRLRSKPPVFHHALSEDVFRRVETPINYARKPGS